MRLFSLASATVVLGFAVASPARAENLAHIQQLLSTRECSNCQLQRAGLVHADLTGVDLTGADLQFANLSQANLVGANLQGANLTGAMLQGANLSGANLQGAILTGTDLRRAYLYGANMEGVDLSSTYIQQSIGLPDGILSFNDYYRWGIEAGQHANYPVAVDYFSKAIQLQPDFAPAYLARAIARYKMIDAEGAISDSTVAADLFAEQGDFQSQAAAQNFIAQINAIEEAASKPPRARGSLTGLLQGLASLLMRFAL